MRNLASMARESRTRAGSASSLAGDSSKAERDALIPTGYSADRLVVLDKPFCRLLHLVPAAAGGPPLLIVSPLSAHRLGLLHDLIAALIPHHDVYVIEWRNARDVPVAEGPFGLDENIAYIVEILQALGPETHVLALSQSPVPAIAAAALMAEADDPAQPLSLTLISGFIDPRVNPRRFDLLVSGTPMSVFSRTVTDRVPAGFGGEGRYIYPDRVQRGALLAYLARHIAQRGELYAKLLFDDGVDPLGHPFFVSYLDLIDLPGEIYVDTMERVLQHCELPRGRMIWRGRPVRPAAITRTALMTIEGECDDVSAVGQTYAAHALCPNVPTIRRAYHRQTGVGHFGTFHGSAWRRTIAPRITGFVRAFAAHR